MVCKNCGFQIPEGDLFCCGCGQRVPQAEPVDDTPELENESPETVVDDGEDYWEETTTPEQPKKKGLKLWLLLGSIGVALAAVVVVLIFIIKANGPAAAVYNGVKNVLDEKNFTVAIDGDVDGYKIATDIQVDLDTENRELTLICVTYEGDDEPDLMAIYDNYVIYSYHDYVYNEDYYDYEEKIAYRARDISDEMEILFDAYGRLEEGDSSLQEMVEALIDDIGDEHLEEAYEEFVDHVNMEALEECLKTYCEALNDESWLEEHANLTTEEEDGMDLYILEPDLYDFTVDSMEYFMEAFEDEDDYDDLKKELKKEAKEEMERVEAEVTLGVEDGYLVYGAIEGEAYNDTYEFTMEITDIGETVVDKQMLEDILDEAEIR